MYTRDTFETFVKHSSQFWPVGLQKKTIYAVLTLFINIFCFCVFVSTGIA